MTTEIKRIVSQVKTAQGKLQGILKNQNWMEEVRKYAEKQGKEAKKLLTSDVAKVKTFIEKERKELARFQKQIPGEVKKLRTFVEAQRKELEKLLVNVRKATANGKARGTKRKKPTGGGARTKSKKSSSSASSGA